MGSTFISLHYHIVFSTKHRQPLIKTSWRERLQEYLGGTVNGLLASLRDAHRNRHSTGGALRDHRLMAEKPPAWQMAEKPPAWFVAEKPPAWQMAEKRPAWFVAEKPPAWLMTEKPPD